MSLANDVSIVRVNVGSRCESSFVFWPDLLELMLLTSVGWLETLTCHKPCEGGGLKVSASF